MGSLGTPGSGRDSGVGVRGREEAAWTGLAKACSEGFPEPSDPVDKGRLRGWL